MGWGSFVGSITKAVSSVISSPVGRIIAKAVPFLSPILSFVSIVSTALTWLRKPDEPEFNFDTTAENIAKGVLVNKTSANGQIPIVYGTRKVGGIISFLETSGTDNEYLYMILALSEGEIDDITQIYINDNLVTWSGDLADDTERTVASSDSNYYKDSASLISVKPHYGSDSQTYDTLVGSLSSWTSNHRLRGIAYLALKFKWNQDAFGSIPIVHAVVKGKKIYNPNLDGTLTGGSGSHRADTTSTWEYSDNPVYQLLDYLRNTRFGMGIANGYFDSNFADWQTAGDVCDADITPYSGASTIDLIDSHAVVDTSKKCIENVNDFLTGCRGYLNYTAGEYKVLVETSGSASITLTEDNIIGGIGVSSKNKNERYNRVIVTFINPNKNYQVDEAQFPPVDDSAQASADQHATMKTADNGILLEGRFDFPSIKSPYQAQEMAEIILRRSRSSLDVSLTADANSMELAVGDIVNVTHATPSFSAKPFRVLSVTLNPDSSTSLQLTEHQDSYYTFGTQTAVATIPDTTLPNPFTVQPPASLTLTDEMVAYNDGTVITKMNIVVGASTDKFVQNYQVEVKLNSASNYSVLAIGSQLNFEMLNVLDNETYNVRVKAINSLGVSSTYVSENRTIVGATESPEDVTDFSSEFLGNNNIRLTWSPVSDIDLLYYAVRYQSVTSGATWSNSTNLVDVPRKDGTTVVVPNMKDTTFLIKAVDKLGNESINEITVISDVDDFTATQLSSFTETTSFSSGTYTNTALTEDTNGVTIIKLDTITQFDDTIGNFDSPSGDFELGGTDTTSNPSYFGGNISSSGTYDFFNTFDLGYVGQVNFKIPVTMKSDDNYSTFDDGDGYDFFESHPSPFDGTEQTQCNSVIQVSTSTDNVTFGNYHNCTNSTYNGRYFKFRAKLKSKDNKTTPQISSLAATTNLEDRIATGNDIASGTSAKVITFTNPFHATPSLTIIGQNMATGDYFTISSKTKDGYTVNFLNSSGSNVNRTFDWQAVGYGLKTA